MFSKFIVRYLKLDLTETIICITNQSFKLFAQKMVKVRSHITVGILVKHFLCYTESFCPKILLIPVLFLLDQSPYIYLILGTIYAKPCIHWHWLEINKLTERTYVDLNNMLWETKKNKLTFLLVHVILLLFPLKYELWTYVFFCRSVLGNFSHIQKDLL